MKKGKVKSILRKYSKNLKKKGNTDKMTKELYSALALI